MKGRRRDLPGRGRFAPSPTGELHFGSIVAAVASFLDARSRGDEWLVRIDDIDAPRVASGAIATILRELERLGLHWDGDIVYQSTRTGLYAAALEALQAGGHCFPCACTRREVGGRVYPGTCRNGVPAGRTARSIRVRADAGSIGIEDLVQGSCRQDLDRDIGDFIVYRADGVFAYHLATAFRRHGTGNHSRGPGGGPAAFDATAGVPAGSAFPATARVRARTRSHEPPGREARQADPRPAYPVAARVARGLRRASLSRPSPARGARGGAPGRAVVLGDRRMGSRPGTPSRGPRVIGGQRRLTGGIPAVHLQACPRAGWRPCRQRGRGPSRDEPSARPETHRTR